MKFIVAALLLCIGMVALVSAKTVTTTETLSTKLIDPTFSKLMDSLDAAMMSTYTELEDTRNTDEIKVAYAEAIATAHSEIEKSRCSCKGKIASQQQACLNKLIATKLSNVKNGCDIYKLGTSFYSRLFKQNKLTCAQSVDVLCGPYYNEFSSLGVACRMTRTGVCDDAMFCN